MDYSRAKSPNIGNVLNARRLARRKLQRSAIREREKQEIEKKVNRKYNVIYQIRSTSNLQSALDQNRLQKHRTSLYQLFFFCFIDANFWNEVEGKRFVIRDDIPHVAVGYAGLSISKFKKDCLSITPQFVASVDTNKKIEISSHQCIQNKYPFKWLKKESYCMLFNFISKMYFRLYICRILYSLVVLVT